MPQFYLVTFGLSVIIGWMLNDFYHAPSKDLLIWMFGIFVIIYVNEKTALLERIKNWMKR
jgi:hypothetical protein